MYLNYIMPRGFLWVLPKKCPLKRHNKLSPKKQKKCRLKSTKNWAPLFCSGDLARVVLTGRQKRGGQVEHCFVKKAQFQHLQMCQFSRYQWDCLPNVEVVFRSRCLLSEGELDRVGGSHRWARERGKGRPVLPPGGPGRHLPSGGREHPLLPSLPTAGHKGWADPVQVNLTFQEEKCSADHFWIYLIFSTLQV